MYSFRIYMESDDTRWPLRQPSGIVRSRGSARPRGRYDGLRATIATDLEAADQYREESRTFRCLWTWSHVSTCLLADNI